MANIGETREGRTGTYRYVGGDEKDKNSWELVVPSTVAPGATTVIKPEQPEQPQKPAESGVGQPTRGPYGTLLELVNKIPVVGGVARKGLDVPQTLRNITSKAGLSGIAESVPYVKTGYVPPTEAEKRVQESGRLLGTVGQAAGGAGMGTVAAKALSAPKTLTEVLQLAGASAPSVAKAGTEGGPSAAASQGLVDLLIGLATKGTGKGISKFLPKPQELTSEQKAANAVARLMGTPEPHALITGKEEALKRAQKSLSRTSEGKILAKTMGKEKAAGSLVSGFGPGNVPKKLGPAEIQKAFEKASTVEPEIGATETRLPNIIREVQTKILERPGKLAANPNILNKLSADAEDALDNVAKGGWKLSDVNDLRRTYAGLSSKETDPIKKQFYQEMTEAINKRLATSSDKATRILETSKYGPGQMVRAEQQYITNLAEQKAKDAARQAALKKWGTRGIVAGLGGGGTYLGARSIADLLTGNK
jgi:malonyl CoA-acyl carrier protein transacylase